MEKSDNVSVSGSRTGSVTSKKAEENVFDRSKGLTVPLTAFFMVAQMAGAGFLSLPRAMADAGWIGLALVLLFCLSNGFTATRLGRSWVMLEQRWPKYRQPQRQPYMNIAEEALGTIGRRLAMFCVLVTLTGNTIVYISLISELMQSLVPRLSLCEWAVITAVVLTPASWLGSPKDFWQASVFAVISTVVAIIIIVIKILLDYGGDTLIEPTYPNPTVYTFSLGFGAILFAFGGASVFPTIQNDMQDRSLFWKSVIGSFTVMLSLYLPVAIIGYLMIGDDVDNNILLSVDSSPAVTVAIVLQIFNLLGTYIISLSPVVQSLEETFSISPEFGPKRILIRSLLIMFELIIVLSIPDFGLILNLVGGSTTCSLSFIFPPLMYMKLMDDKTDNKWRENIVPLWERIFLWEIVIVGTVGGISATVSAIIAIINPDSFTDSCFVTFGTSS